MAATTMAATNITTSTIIRHTRNLSKKPPQLITRYYESSEFRINTHSINLHHTSLRGLILRSQYRYGTIALASWWLIC